MRNNSGCLLLGALIVALIVATSIIAAQTNDQISAAQARRLNANAARVETRARVESESADAAIAAREVLYLGSGVAGVVVMIGTASALVVWLRRRAALIHPTGSGQFPLVRVSGRGWSGVIDPNRSPNSVTVIRDGIDGISPQIAQPSTLSEQGQVALAAQASAVAGIVAATRRGDPGRRGLDAAVKIATPGALSMPLPDVETLEPGHVERLLALNAPAVDVQDVKEGDFWQ